MIGEKVFSVQSCKGFGFSIDPLMASVLSDITTQNKGQHISEFPKTYC